MTDPIRGLLQSQRETQRARRDPHFVQALIAGTAPSALAYVTALDMGHEGEQALTAAHEIDQAAIRFTQQPPADDTPPAA